MAVRTSADGIRTSRFHRPAPKWTSSTGRSPGCLSTHSAKTDFPRSLIRICGPVVPGRRRRLVDLAMFARIDPTNTPLPNKWCTRYDPGRGPNTACVQLATARPGPAEPGRLLAFPDRAPACTGSGSAAAGGAGIMSESRDFLAASGPAMGAGSTPPFTHLNGGPIQWGQVKPDRATRSKDRRRQSTCAKPASSHWRQSYVSEQVRVGREARDKSAWPEWFQQPFLSLPESRIP